MDWRAAGKAASVGLMVGGAVAAYVLTANVDGFVVTPVWKVLLGAYLAANGVLLNYLPAAKPDA